MGDEIEHSDFVQKLIDAVRECRCLYDKKHIAYFNRREREKAWRHIGQQLGRKDTDCHKRWKLLREKLAKELKKRDRALDNGEQFNSNWACFRNIMFVEDHIAPRRKSDRLDCTLPTNLSKKHIAIDSDSEAYDLTKKRPYRSNDINFLVQLSKASASQASDLGSAYESDTLSEVKTEPEDRQADQINITSFVEKDGSPCSQESQLTVRSQTPETLDLTKVVDALLQDIRGSKANGLSFLKNLTNVLNVKDLDVCQLAQNEYPKFDNDWNNDEIDNISEPNSEQIYNSFQFIKDGNAKNILDNKFKAKSPQNVCEGNTFSKDILSQNIKGDTNYGNYCRIKKLDPHKETTKCQPFADHLHFIGEKDLLFGRLVTRMLVDITDEDCKDDAKCSIMQLLVNAKRACNGRKQKSPESTSKD